MVLNIAGAVAGERAAVSRGQSHHGRYQAAQLRGDVPQSVHTDARLC